MTKKLFSFTRVYQYYLPVTLLLFFFVTIERQVETDGGYDRLYGLPLPWRSSSFAWSFHQHILLLPMTVNILFYFGLSVLLFAGLEKTGMRFKSYWILIILTTLLLLVCIPLLLIMIKDCSFFLVNEVDYKTTGRRLLIEY